MKRYLEYLGPGEVSIIKVGSFSTGTVHEVDEVMARDFVDDSNWSVHETSPHETPSMYAKPWDVDGEGNTSDNIEAPAPVGVKRGKGGEK
ncbi:MAG: hypothetical protein HZA22_04730 [Nitrospirae bacterium]|nr:hypothetical protein [Nitrospirota bacterium]